METEQVNKSNATMIDNTEQALAPVIKAPNTVI